MRVVHESVWRANDLCTGRSGYQIDILRVAVVADVQRGPGIGLIGEEEIGIDIFSRLDTRISRIHKIGVVLQDEANRKLSCELPVPARADGVVVEDF